MIRRVVSILVVLALWLPTAGTANADDFAFSVGRDIGAVDFTGANAVTNLGTRLGYRFDRLQIFGTADFARFSLSTDYASPDFNDSENTGALYTLGIGTRYLLQSPEGGNAIPYLLAAGFTVIPSTPGSSPAVDQDTSGFVGGAMAGFGAEYFFDESFSVGGEVGASGLFGYLQQETTRWDGNILQIYSGVQLNFYL